MIMQQIFSIVFVMGPASIAQEQSSFEDLLQQAAETELTAGFEARRQLSAACEAASEDLWAEYSVRLQTALGDARPAMRIVAARTLALRPGPQEMQQILARLPVEEESSVQQALARSTAAGVRRLPAELQASMAESAAAILDDMIRSDQIKPDTRNVLTLSLGNLGTSALPAVRAFVADPQWGKALHSSLPATLAATGELSACADIQAMYEANKSQGFRIACLSALGALLRRGAEANGTTAQAALELLRSLILQPSALSAKAAEAYSRWPAARNDSEIVAVVRKGLTSSTGDDRTAYLRAAFMLGLGSDEEIRVTLKTEVEAPETSVVHRKLASAILETVVESP